MLSWYKRKQQQFWAWTAAGVAGVTAAYLAYTWYITPSATETDEAQGNDACELKQADAVSDVEKQLIVHIQELQDIAHTQTLPAVHRQLEVALEEHSAIEDITAELRRLRTATAATSPASRVGPTDPSAGAVQAAKLSLWLDLRDRSFTHLAATTWLLPALTLLAHVQLTVLGRHTYLKSVMGMRDASQQGLLQSAGLARPSGAHDQHAPTVTQLSEAQKAAYMSYGSFLIHDGLRALMPRLGAVVQRQTARYQLQETVSLAQVWEILSCVHEAIDAEVSAEDWSSYLLPPITLTTARGAGAEQSDADALLQRSDEIMRRCNASHAPAGSRSGELESGCRLPLPFFPVGMSHSAANVVAELVLETRRVVQATLFLGVLRKCVRHCAEAAANRVALTFQTMNEASAQALEQYTNGDATAAHSVKVPLATIVPKVALVSRELLADSESLSKSLFENEEVQALLERVYSRGPFLDRIDDPVCV